jgi:hypothetical protein
MYFNDQCQSWKVYPNQEEMFSPGMVTSAIPADMDMDGDLDIIAAYEYGPIRIFINTDGRFSPGNKELESYSGLWNHVSADDLDGDGDLDLVACNHGLNSRLKADSINPLVLYINDFDGNGQTEQILCWRKDGKDYPVTLKDDLLKQLPYLNKKYTTYAAYATATMQDMFEPEQIKQSIVYLINEMRSGIFYNEKGVFEFTPLPDEAQWTNQYVSWLGDIDGDHRMDIVLGGNQYAVKPEIGISAASYGTVLIQQENGKFLSSPFQASGFFEHGEIRDIQFILIGGQPHLIIMKNNDTPSIYAVPHFTSPKTQFN